MAANYGAVFDQAYKRATDAVGSLTELPKAGNLPGWENVGVKRVHGEGANRRIVYAQEDGFCVGIEVEFGERGGKRAGTPFLQIDVGDLDHSTEDDFYRLVAEGLGEKFKLEEKYWGQGVEIPTLTTKKYGPIGLMMRANHVEVLVSGGKKNCKEASKAVLEAGINAAEKMGISFGPYQKPDTPLEADR